MLKLVTCPESAHLEEIDFDLEPSDGRILQIVRCSAFSPACRVTCERLCQKALNKRLETRKRRP